MTTKRVIKGVFFSYGGQPFAFLFTEQPLDIAGCGDLIRRAQAASGGMFGKVTVRFVESPQYPTLQGYVIIPDAARVQFASFLSLVMNRLLPGCDWDTRRVTDFDREAGSLLAAFFARERFLID